MQSNGLKNRKGKIVRTQQRNKNGGIQIMSRWKNLYDGSTYMTPKNALRHCIRKLEIALKENNYEKMKSVRRKMVDNGIDTYYCDFCIKEDIGYCGLRGQYGKNITLEEKEIKYCYPSLLLSLKNKLEKKMEKY